MSWTEKEGVKSPKILVIDAPTNYSETLLHYFDTLGGRPGIPKVDAKVVNLKKDEKLVDAGNIIAAHKDAKDCDAIVLFNMGSVGGRDDVAALVKKSSVPVLIVDSQLKNIPGATMLEGGDKLSESAAEIMRAAKQNQNRTPG